MRIDGKWYRTIWVKDGDEAVVQVIDQRHLPHRFAVEDVTSVEEMAVVIKDMHVRGAGLIGCAAAYGVYLAVRCWGEDAATGASQGPAAQLLEYVRSASQALQATRPTAVNLRVGAERVEAAIDAALKADAADGGSGGDRAAADVAATAVAAALAEAGRVTDEDANACQRIGEFGSKILKDIRDRKLDAGETSPVVNVLTHCNAGWLAFADWGSALSPVYAAFDDGVAVHVWVDETRPRNQGAALTAWELAGHGVPHTVIADNAGGHLMQRGMVDMVITGADRVTRGGDVCNKIGTYLKALAARDNSVPFYVALPSSTIDWSMEDGRDIPIEQRGADEVCYAEGICEADGEVRRVRLTPAGSRAGNWAFDVTPRLLVTGLLTERGLSDASSEGLAKLFPAEAASAIAAAGEA